MSKLKFEVKKVSKISKVEVAGRVYKLYDEFMEDNGGTIMMIRDSKKYANHAKKFWGFDKEDLKFEREDSDGNYVEVGFDEFGFSLDVKDDEGMYCVYYDKLGYNLMEA